MLCVDVVESRINICISLPIVNNHTTWLSSNDWLAVINISVRNWIVSSVVIIHLFHYGNLLISLTYLYQPFMTSVVKNVSFAMCGLSSSRPMCTSCSLVRSHSVCYKVLWSYCRQGSSRPDLAHAQAGLKLHWLPTYGIRPIFAWCGSLTLSAMLSWMIEGSLFSLSQIIYLLSFLMKTLKNQTNHKLGSDFILLIV